MRRDVRRCVPWLVLLAWTGCTRGDTPPATRTVGGTSVTPGATSTPGTGSSTGTTTTVSTTVTSGGDSTTSSSSGRWVDCPLVSNPPTLSKDARFVDVKVAGGSGCALDREGYLTCFGEGSEELAAVMPREAVLDFEVIGGVRGHVEVCALMASDRSVKCWASNAPPAVSLEGVTDVRLFSFSGLGGLALRDDGTLYCWAFEEGVVSDCNADAYNGIDLQQVAGINGYHYASLVLMADRKLYKVWHHDGVQPLEESVGILSSDHIVDYCYTDQESGVPTCDLNGRYRWSPSPCPWIDLSFRSQYVVGIRRDGTLEAGVEPVDDMLPFTETPILPSGTFVKVDGDPFHSGCALTPEGELACWDYAGILTRNVP